MPEEYELIPVDPIRKLESEVEELKQYLKSIKEELNIKTHENINNKELQNRQYSSEDTHLIRALIDYAKTNQESINSLIKTNIELQSKVAELVVSTHELNKNINKLLEIFEEAAIEYMEKMKTKESAKKEGQDHSNNELLKRLEDLEKVNVKIAEALDKLSKSIENIKNTGASQPQGNIKKVLPPPIKPPFLPTPPQRQPFR